MNYEKTIWDNCEWQALRTVVRGLYPELEIVGADIHYGKTKTGLGLMIEQKIKGENQNDSI